MVDLLGVQVRHSPGHVLGKGETEPPVEGNVVILQHIVETSLGTVLLDDAEITDVLDGSSDELAQVWVIYFPVCE